MRYTFLLSLFALIAFPSIASADADARKPFYGTWGTAKQCARKPIKAGGTVLAQPFEISPQWLKQGQLWCSLKWFPTASLESGLASGATAQCGEDSVRDYLLGFKLSKDKLNIRWDLFLNNGPLARCTGS